MAIKFIKREKDIPEKIGRPTRDLGEPIRPCTAYYLVRQQGHSIAMLEEDFSTGCPAGLFIFGIMEPIKSWIEGDLAYEIYAGTREAAAGMESRIFRLETDKFKGMALAPFRQGKFYSRPYHDVLRLKAGHATGHRSNIYGRRTFKIQYGGQGSMLRRCRAALSNQAAGGCPYHVAATGCLGSPRIMKSCSPHL